MEQAGTNQIIERSHQGKSYRSDVPRAMQERLDLVREVMKDFSEEGTAELRSAG